MFLIGLDPVFGEAFAGTWAPVGNPSPRVSESAATVRVFTDADITPDVRIKQLKLLLGTLSRWAAYACSRNRKIGFCKLTNFAVGVFWKASVHSWRKNKGGPMIQLGKYGEEFRRFLVGKGRFPKHATLVVGVSPPENAVIGFMMPHFRGVSMCHQFVFYVPGIIFVLQVGKQISDYERQLCFYSDPLHPIIVADLAKDIYGLVGRHAAKAVRSKEVSDYLNAKRGR